MVAQGTAILSADKNVVQEFDTAQLRTYLSDPAYQYQKRAPQESWLGRLWQSVLDYFERLFSENAGFGERMLAILLIGGAIVILSFFLLRSRFQNIFSRGDKRNRKAMRILNEDVLVSQLSQRIQAALDSGDFRTAYRWTYIDLLHSLGQSGVIRLHGNKTNTDYKLEIKASLIKEDFTVLADAFDFTWYGEYPIDRSTFDEYTSRVANVLKQTSTT